MKHRVLFLSLACAAALAACQTSATVPSFVANAARSDRAGTTQAWGYCLLRPRRQTTRQRPRGNRRVGAGPRQTPAIPSSRANQRRGPVRIHRAQRQVSPNDRQRRSLHAAARTIKPPTRSPQSATIPASPTCTGSQPYTTRSSSAEATSKSKHPYFQNKPMPAKPAAHTNMCEYRQSSKQETIASPNSQESKRNALPPNRFADTNSTATHCPR